MPQDDALSQSFMLLSFTAAGLIVAIHLQASLSSEEEPPMQARQSGAESSADFNSSGNSFEFSEFTSSSAGEMTTEPAEPPSRDNADTRHRHDATTAFLSAASPAITDENSSSSQAASASQSHAESDSGELSQVSPPAVRVEDAVNWIVSRPVHTTWTLLNPLVQDATRPISDLSDLDVTLIIQLGDRQVHLYQAGERQVSYPIAVGRAGWETPTGEFRVTDKRQNPSWQNPITGEVIPPGPDNPLGAHWIAFWSNGTNQIGFHGTNASDLIGQAVSHGCVRMENAHIQDLYKRVEIGTPVIVQP